jgi:two-component system KDP operon response regulator KdpE
VQPSILLVDDDQQIIRAILPAMRVSGFHVTTAGTVSQATRQIDAYEFDTLIVDLGLPDGDGKDVVRHLRKLSAKPVIIISARHSDIEVEAALTAGANAFLHKPFSTPALVSSIREHLRS